VIWGSFDSLLVEKKNSLTLARAPPEIGKNNMIFLSPAMRQSQKSLLCSSIPHLPAHQANQNWERARVAAH
jgi:hypothetical protein